MIIKFGLPQIIWLALGIFGIAFVAIHHGEEHEPYNVNTEIAGFLIANALLFWGGFFS
jgi:hypothetical protein